MGYSYILKPLSNTLNIDVLTSIAYDELKPLVECLDHTNIQTYLLRRILNDIIETRNWDVDIIIGVKTLSSHVLEIDNLFMSDEKLNMPETIDELHKLLDAIDFILNRYKNDLEVFIDLQMLFIEALPVNNKTARLIYSHIIRRA